VPPSLSLSISCFFKTHVVEDPGPHLATFPEKEPLRFPPISP
jgi:hypothetical protein